MPADQHPVHRPGSGNSESRFIPRLAVHNHTGGLWAFLHVLPRFPQYVIHMPMQPSVILPSRVPEAVMWTEIEHFRRRRLRQP